MYHPKISVITVCYNCKALIKKTLISISLQTYPNVEYIIIDGGSTDGTLEVIRKYNQHIDYFISEPDNGIYDAMNKGLAASSGEWVIFMNAGDFFASTRTLEQIVPLIHDNSIVVYGDIIIQRDGYYYNLNPAGVKQIASKMPVFHQASFIRLDYHKTHLFDATYRSSGDYAFFYKCCVDDKCVFQYVPCTVSCYDDIEGMSKDNHALSLRENLRIWDKEGDWLFRFKLEFDLLKYTIVKIIKNVLLNRKERMNVEIRSLKRKGISVILGEYSLSND